MKQRIPYGELHEHAEALETQRTALMLALDDMIKRYDDTVRDEWSGTSLMKSGLAAIDHHRETLRLAKEACGQ